MNIKLADLREESIPAGAPRQMLLLFVVKLVVQVQRAKETNRVT
tara:strand:+ start:276 stop:407 length:132 start_codon:yes stop_codon:yes gene_type:complete